eukprot:4919911-Prymnesium_polylepis.1
MGASAGAVLRMAPASGAGGGGQQAAARWASSGHLRYSQACHVAWDLSDAWWPMADVVARG